MIPSRITTLLFALLIGTATTQAQDRIQAVEPFEGQASENFDQIITTSFQIKRSIDVLGGDLTFASLTPPPGSTTIHLWFGSCLGGNCAIPRSRNYLIGATTRQAIVFNRPAMRFGSYFTNTSGRPDATARFYDTRGNFLESELVRVPSAGTDWYWNGWKSEVPIGRIEFTGNGTLEGFLWFDDLEVDYEVVASCTPRNGTGVNPVDFSCTNAPVLGTAWSTVIDTTPTIGEATQATTILAGLGGPTSGPVLPFGELLVLAPIAIDTRTGPGVGTHTIAVPASRSLLGAPLHTQGVRFETATSMPTQIVLLNAIDLVLGR